MARRCEDRRQIGAGLPTMRYRPFRMYDAEGDELWPMRRVADYLGVSMATVRLLRIAKRFNTQQIGPFFAAYPSDIMLLKKGTVCDSCGQTVRSPVA